MLRLLTGRSGCGKTMLIIDELKKVIAEGDKKCIVLVPQHYSHEYERLLAEACGVKASLYCEVLTMKRLAYRVFSEAGGLARGYLDESGRLLAMSLSARAVETQLKSFGRYIRNPSFIAELLATRDELASCRISCSELEDAAALCAAAQCDTALSQKLQDLSLILSAYDARIHLGDADPHDQLTELNRKLSETHWASSYHFYIEGYSELTRQEAEILRTLMRTAQSVTFSLTLSPDFGREGDLFEGQRRTADLLRRFAESDAVPVETVSLSGAAFGKADALRYLEASLFLDGAEKYRENSGAITVWREPSPLAECERTASEILRLCREDGAFFSDIAIAVSGFEAYAPILESVMSEWGVPVFTDRVENILKKPLVSAICAALDAVANGFDSGDILRFIKSGLCGVSFEEACELENYVYLWNIRGIKWVSGDWTMSTGGFSDGDSEKLSRLNDIRRRVSTPFSNLRSAVYPGELPAHTHLKAIYTFLEESGIKAAVEQRAERYFTEGELKLSSEYSQLWSKLCAAIDTCADTLGDTPIQFSELAELFKLILSGLQIGTIPPALDSVAAGEAGRLRHRKVKYLFLIGSSSFPEAAQNSGLLSDTDRETLISLGVETELPLSRQTFRQTDTAYAVLTIPSNRLYISTLSTKPDSYITSRIIKLFGLSVLPPADDTKLIEALSPCFSLAVRAAGGDASPCAKAAYDWFYAQPDKKALIDKTYRAASGDRGRLGPSGFSLLYGDTVNLTASRADTVNSCRFSYFMRYGLKLRKRERASFSAPESGTFLHYVLEGVVKEVSSHGGFHTVTSAQLKEITEHNIAAYAINALGGLSDKSARIRFLYERLRRTAHRVVENIADELNESLFEPLECEMNIAGEELTPDGARLYGVVDRVDGWANGDKLYIRVVDYKSGVKQFDLTDIWNGLSLQMLLYLFLLEKQGFKRYGKETVAAGVLYVPVKEIFYNGTRGESDEKIKSGIAKQLRRSGLILEDSDVIEAMEPGVAGRFIPVGVKAEGFASASSIAALDLFGKLKRHIEDLLTAMTRELKNGSVEANPYQRDLRHTACDYCEFASICLFDKTNGRDRLRRLEKVSREEFWNKLEEV